MNIDKIKWMVGYADGFEMDELYGYAPYVIYFKYRHIAKYITKWEHFPLLLTRTIEGINRHWLEGGIYHIVQGKSYVSVYTLGSSDIQKYSMNEPDKAKQSAIDYVYKQEQE